MESSSPQRRRDRGGDAEVNRGLQLSLRCLGGLCASAVNSIYSHAFLKALIVNNFNLHTLQINETSEPTIPATSHFIWFAVSSEGGLIRLLSRQGGLQLTGGGVGRVAPREWRSTGG